MTRVVIAALALLAGCFDVTIPAEAGAGAGFDFDALTPNVAGDVGGSPLGEQPPPPRRAVDGGANGADAPVALPPSCNSHCDCPPDFDCINERCVLGDEPIECCTHPQCPAGAECWFINGTSGLCP